MPDKKRKKREAPISYRPPAELREELEARIQKSGLSTSAFITKSVFTQDAPRQSRRPAIEEKLLAWNLAEAAKITDRLDEILLVHGDAAWCDERFGLAFEALIDLRNDYFKATGKKP